MLLIRIEVGDTCTKSIDVVAVTLPRQKAKKEIVPLFPVLSSLSFSYYFAP